MYSCSSLNKLYMLVNVLKKKFTWSENESNKLNREVLLYHCINWAIKIKPKYFRYFATYDIKVYTSETKQKSGCQELGRQDVEWLLNGHGFPFGDDDEMF